MQDRHKSPPETRRTLDCRGRKLELGPVMQIVGILNVTDDSFFDGGRYSDVNRALAQAARLVNEGAAMIDVGGMSTRPGHAHISPDEEIRRIIPVLEQLIPAVPVPVSIDTFRPTVARAALNAGAHVVNDIFGLQHDTAMAPVIAEFGCPAILMHQDPDFKTTPGDSIEKMNTFFHRTLEIADKAGIRPETVILDPGIGFGKTQEQNLEIMGRLDELRALGFPVLLGASRKSVIAYVLDLPADQRLEATLATSVLAARQGVELVRVHDVAANLRAIRMTEAIVNASHS